MTGSDTLREGVRPCHLPPRRAVTSGRSAVPVISGATTLAALRATSTECVACHAAKDIHQGRLGTSCAECHSPATLDGRHHRPRPDALCSRRTARRGGVRVLPRRSALDGDRPDLPQLPRRGRSARRAVPRRLRRLPRGDRLEGRHLRPCPDAASPWTVAHAKPACAACHADGRYVGTPTSCVGCHAGDDQHRGAFGTDCASCHTTDDLGGRDVRPRQVVVPADRRPPQRDLPEVPCRRGRTRERRRPAPPVTPKPASHGSAFGSSCASCHTTKAWLPASFDHARSSFPLTGAHLQRDLPEVPCRRGVQGNADHVRRLSHEARLARQRLRQQLRVLPLDQGLAAGVVRPRQDVVPADRSPPERDLPEVPCRRACTRERRPPAPPVTRSPPRTAAPSAPTARPATRPRPGCRRPTAGPMRSPGTMAAPAGRARHATRPRWTSYSCARCHSDSSMTQRHREVSRFSLTTCASCHQTGKGD